MSGDDSDSSVASSPAPIVLWILPFLGAVLLPGLWWTSADWPFAFRPDLVLSMTAAVAVFGVATLAALSRGFRHRVRWSLGVAAVAVLVTFQWAALTRAGGAVADATGVGLAADVIPVALGGAFLWISVRLGDEPPFAVITGATLGAVLVWLGVMSLSLVAPGGEVPLDRAVSESAPDVLVIVVDAYARADWLAEEFNFDNLQFLSQLESRGFAIAGTATSNYGFTYASVSTMLNLDYVFQPGEVTDAEREEMRAALTGASGLLSVFRKAGYETVYFENAWAGSQCGAQVDRCIREGIRERALWNLGQMTILAPVFKAFRSDPFNSVSASHLERLGSVAASPSSEGKPRVTFAHFLLPHSPTLLNADCTRRRRSEHTRWGAERGPLLAERRAGYVEQTICVNRLLIEGLDAFLALHPDGIVFITGDHGPASTLDPNLPLHELAPETLQERMRILSAYRVPGCERSLRQDLTPVNGTRLIVNCALGSDLEMVPDLNYWADLDVEGAVADITSQIRE